MKREETMTKQENYIYDVVLWSAVVAIERVISNNNAGKYLPALNMLLCNCCYFLGVNSNGKLISLPSRFTVTVVFCPTSNSDSASI